MELTIEADKLRQYRIFCATPMYGGACHGLYMKSCLDLQNLMTQYGIEVKFSFIFNESLIQRARAYLCDEFLFRSNCTHLLFIDADIAFNPQDVLALLAIDKDVIGAPYPKKSIKFDNLKKAILKNPKINASELSSLGGDYVFNPVHGTEKFSIQEPLEVLEIGTGFMMVKREVFSKFREHYPDLSYKPDHVGQANFDGSRNIHMYFDCYIDPDTRRYLSEDYSFCQRWRNMGGSIFLCPWMITSHIGSYIFEGNLPKVAEFIGEI